VRSYNLYAAGFSYRDLVGTGRELYDYMLLVVAPNIWRDFVLPDSSNKATAIYREAWEGQSLQLQMLQGLVRTINNRAVKPRWEIQEPSKNTPNIELPRLNKNPKAVRKAVVRHDFGDSDDAIACSIIADLLETGQLIRKLGCCATCKKFFV
jgi:hypothetical protein